MKCEGCGTESGQHASNCPIRYGVPTGYVPRVNPVAELERQLLQPDPSPGPMKGIAHFTPPDPIANVPTAVVPRRLKHGDLVKDGDEFNHDPMYYCAKCNGTHTREYKGCDGLRGPPVPTGVVPRVGSYEEAVARMKTIADLSTQLRGAPPADPIAQAVDDYLLMERKARAWDELRKAYEFAEDAAALALMDRLVHPAQEPSTR